MKQSSVGFRRAYDFLLILLAVRGGGAVAVKQKQDRLLAEEGGGGGRARVNGTSAAVNAQSSVSHSELVDQLQAWLSDVQSSGSNLMGNELSELPSLAFAASMMGGEAEALADPVSALAHGKAVPKLSGLTSFGDVMVKFQKGILNTHNTTQGKLHHWTKTVHSTCLKKKAVLKSLTVLKKKLTLSVTNHRKCREEQRPLEKLLHDCEEQGRAYAVEKEAACGMEVLHKLVKHDCIPSTQMTYKSWLDAQLAWFQYQEKDHGDAKLKCAAATKKLKQHSCKRQKASLRRKKTTCENSLRVVESTACTYSTSDISCKLYDQCFNYKRKAYEKDVVEARKESNTLKLQWRMTQRFRCLFSAIGASGGVQEDKFNTCISHGAHATDHLNYVYPKFPPKQACSTPTIRPGSGPYRTLIYEGLPTGMRLRSPTKCPLSPNRFKEPVFILDAESAGCSRVQKCYDYGQCYTIVGCEGISNAPFSGNATLTTSTDGFYYVTDPTTRRVDKCPQHGAGACVPIGNFFEPVSAYAGSNRTIAVADKGANRIQLCGPNYTALNYTKSSLTCRTLVQGAPGACPLTRMSSPSSFVVDPIDGHYLVTSADKNRIQKCSKRGLGTCVTVAGNDKCRAGSGRRKLSSPSKVVVDLDGSYLVVDTNNHRIQKCKREKKVLKSGFKFLVHSLTKGNLGEGLTKLTGRGRKKIRPFRRVREGFKTATATFKNLTAAAAARREGRQEARKKARKDLFDRLVPGVKRIFGIGKGRCYTLIGGKKEGSRFGRLNSPTDILVDVDGSYLVADSGNRRILRCLRHRKPTCRNIIVDSMSLDGKVTSLATASGGQFTR